MDSMTPYPPLVRAPLRMRGIFGIAWQLYKRGFWQLFLVSLLLVGLPVLLMMLPYFSMINMVLPDIQSEFVQFGQLSDFSTGAGFQQVGAMLGSMLLVCLVGLVWGFLFMPMYQGAVYLEMEERMEGRAGTLGQIFRYALPIGLKRFYTTFLAQYVLQMGFGLVVSVIYTFGVFGMVFSAISSFRDLENGALPTPFLITFGIVIALIFLLALIFYTFIALIYPVAAHEKKFAFAAIGRTFKLTIRHFWRILGATLLCSLVVGLLSWILCLPALLLWQNVEAMFVLLVVLSAVGSAFTTPYAAAFRTALYVDISARVDGPEYSVIDPDTVPDPDPDELRDGPRTL